MKRNIRIKDIAKMANVSIGTVDRVIHKRGEVSDESYKKVLAILEKTGYKPNLLARSLGSGKTFKISALIPNPSEDEYWNMAQDGVKKALEEWAHHRVVVQTFNFDLYNKSSYTKSTKAILKSNPDGILTAPIFHKEALDFFATCRSKSIPYVLFNNNIPDANGLAFVGQDLYQSGQVGAELLHIDQKGPGKYAILHIYDDISNSVHLREKEKGFNDYFKSLKGSRNEVISMDLNIKHRQTLEKELREMLSEKSLKGILVTTSKGASIVSRLLEQHGKNGIRLVAYDMLEENIEFLRKGVIDFLINQNSEQQAFTAIDELASFLVLKKTPIANNLFPLEIITRSNLQSYLARKGKNGSNGS